MLSGFGLCWLGLEDRALELSSGGAPVGAHLGPGLDSS